MRFITLRVIDGADRGRSFANIPVPLTIGREEGNSIQLNDDRVSRFHLKLQEDQNKIVLTDLQSTNGTKVNGEPVQLWTLRPGDVITLGHSVLVYGSHEEIARRLAVLRESKTDGGVAFDAVDSLDEPNAATMDFELGFPDVANPKSLLHTLTPPELPAGLSPCQMSQVAELLLYMHLRLRGLIDSVEMQDKGENKDENKDEHVTLDQREWQNIVELQSRIARYLHTIGEPEF
jgi:hypothetical protein